MKRCFNCMEEKPENLAVCPHCGFDESAPEESSDRLKPGSLLKDRFIVGRPLGRGGFGITYIAWDNSLRRKVAIKEYLPRGLASREPGGTTVSYDADIKEIFLHGVEKTLEESRKLAGFSTLESVVTVYDCFKENGTAYIVMELLRGENVKERLRREGPIPFGETLGIIAPVLRTLSTVHKAGIVHRDISPDNIFICDNGKIKLLDFGSARAADSDPEKSRSIVLKHGYAPKEQYSSKGRQGPYTDIYAVCATMYKMLTGTTPAESLERLDGEDELRDISELAQLPQAAAAAVMKGLAVNAAERIQTAEELLGELTKEMPEPAGEKTAKTEPEPAPAVKKGVADDGDETKTLLTQAERETVIPLEDMPDDYIPENGFHRMVKRVEEGRNQEGDEGKALQESKGKYKSRISKMSRAFCIALVFAILAGTVAGIIWAAREKSQVAVEKEKTTYVDGSGGGVADVKPGEYMVATDGPQLNMRTNASKTSTIVAKIPNGTKVEVTKATVDWAFITYYNAEGWVQTKYLVEYSAKTETTEKETTTKKATTTTTKRIITEEEYKAAYKKFLLNYLKENPEAAVTDSGGETAYKFGYIYLDEDDIPELVIVPRLTNRGSKAALYYYDGKDVRKVGEYGPYGAFYFVIGKGIVICDSTHYPFGHVEYSSFENGKVTPIAVFHYDYLGEENPEEYDYYIDEKPVTYEEYQKEEKRIRKECDADKAVYTDSFTYYNLSESWIDVYFK